MSSQGMPPIEKLFDLSGRTAVITGAASGFGEAIALGFAQYGCDIVAADVNLAGAEAVAAEVAAKGRRSLPVKMDVADPEQIEAGFAAAEARFGGVDILVNSAGVSPHEPAEDTRQSTWDWAIDINLRGAFLCCQQAGRRMLKQGKGSIINISSIAGHIGFPRGVAIYCASKGGMDAFTRQLAVEWSGRGIRVNSLAPCQFMTPGLEEVMRDPQFNSEKLMRTWTENIPMGRIGQAWEIVGPAVFLASDAASMVTGVSLLVDGGYLAR